MMVLQIPNHSGRTAHGRRPHPCAWLASPGPRTPDVAGPAAAADQGGVGSAPTERTSAAHCRARLSRPALPPSSPSRTACPGRSRIAPARGPHASPSHRAASVVRPLVARHPSRIIRPKGASRRPAAPCRALAQAAPAGGPRRRQRRQAPGRCSRFPRGEGREREREKESPEREREGGERERERGKGREIGKGRG